MNRPAITHDTRIRVELEARIARDFRQFDYDTISDVILNVRYTSIDGGDKLQNIAANSVTDYMQQVIEK